MCGIILDINFSLNSQVLIDLYMDNTGFRLNFKPKLTDRSHHVFHSVLLVKEQREACSVWKLCPYKQHKCSWLKRLGFVNSKHVY